MGVGASENDDYILTFDGLTGIRLLAIRKGPIYCHLPRISIIFAKNVDNRLHILRTHKRSLFHPPVPSYLGLYKKLSLGCNKEQIVPTHLTVMLSAAAFSYIGTNCVSVLNLCSNTFTFLSDVENNESFCSSTARRSEFNQLFHLSSNSYGWYSDYQQCSLRSDWNSAKCIDCSFNCILPSSAPNAEHSVVGRRILKRVGSVSAPTRVLRKSIPVRDGQKDI